jgi:hypothetical protein
MAFAEKYDRLRGYHVLLAVEQAVLLEYDAGQVLTGGGSPSLEGQWESLAKMSMEVVVANHRSM